MSHHFDSLTVIEDGSLNLCDVYAFGSRPGNTSLILTVNPDAGRSSPTTFRSEAVHEFVVESGATDGPILFLRVRFSEPSNGLVGHRRGTSLASFAPSCTFPYGPPAHTGELPALLELSGLRPSGADPTAVSSR
jgi:hypothetical protein